MTFIVFYVMWKNKNIVYIADFDNRNLNYYYNVSIQKYIINNVWDDM